MNIDCFTEWVKLHEEWEIAKSNPSELEPVIVNIRYIDTGEVDYVIKCPRAFVRMIKGCTQNEIVQKIHSMLIYIDLDKDWAWDRVRVNRNDLSSWDIQQTISVDDIDKMFSCGFLVNCCSV